MLYDHTLLYEQAYAIHLNEPADSLFYYFDYDERSPSINMEFQHFHQFYELHILLDQKATHIIEGDFYAIQQYDMVLLRPSLLHKTQYPEGPPRKRLIINFAMPRDIVGLQSNFETLFTLFDEPVPIFRFSEEIRKPILHHINEIFTLSKSDSPLSPLSIHCKFIEFLCSIYQYKEQNSYFRQEISDTITSKIYAITSYIHSNYSQPLSLGFISSKFFISSYYLSRQFKIITGFTLTSYIQMTRIRNAQQLLMDTNRKVTEIAEQCGFTSFSQFNRVFNKHSGLSPSQFRLQGAVSKPMVSKL